MVEQKEESYGKPGQRNNQEHVMPLPPAHGGGRGKEEDGKAHGGDPPVRAKFEAAVFKKGVLGNFEPKEPPKSYKPGEHKIENEMLHEHLMGLGEVRPTSWLWEPERYIENVLYIFFHVVHC